MRGRERVWRGRIGVGDGRENRNGRLWNRKETGKVVGVKVDGKVEQGKGK